ncbi:hypothetical protein [Psychroserpens luteus]|uniref:Uncharacterized protein n=1 Tax=Psychroserpens luteus TaxID=1434066 RepID=A0ABW5ZQI9_9FLAO|nr:hypothetical protein [Psychroserpens luteus]
MRKITLNRPKESFNKNYSYEILIGDHTLTELNNGEEKTVEIPTESENQTLKAKIQWCGSEEIELQNIKENEKIIVIGNKFLNRKMPLIGAMLTIIALMILNLKIVSKNIGIGFFIIFLIVIFGTITVWRNKWLNIKTE